MKCLTVVPFVATLLVGPSTLSPPTIDPPSSEQDNPRQVMLILRGIANAENPRGQLDDEAALAYADRLRFKGEVLDIAGDNYAGNPQVEKALERIRTDREIAAIYGFSGGGYNARLIWKQLEPPHQGRIRKIVVIGSPGVTKNDFPGRAEVLIKADPPEGHLAGPRRLLESLDAEQGHHNRRRRGVGCDTRTCWLGHRSITSTRLLRLPSPQRDPEAATRFAGLAR